jgi:O-antigen/teichoic acid export membrane protein
VIARCFGLVAVVVMTRRLEPGGFGLITVGATLVIWFALVVDSGTEILNVREISRRPDRFRQIAEPILGLRAVLGAIAMALFVVPALAVAESAADRATLMLFALVLPMIALNLRWMVLGVREPRAIATGNIAGQIFFAVGVLVLVNSPHDALKVPLVQAGGELVYALCVVAGISGRFGFVRPRVDLGVWWRNIRVSWPLLANHLARATVYSFDIFLIAAVLGRTEVGLYGAAYKPVLFVVTALGLFYVSFLSAYSASEPGRGTQLFRRSMLMSAGATVPLALVLSLGAGVAVSLVYGEPYAPAAGPLSILIWTVPILAVSGAYSNALIAGDSQRTLMRNNVAGATFNVLANLIVVPLAGIEGAAVVTVLSELLVVPLNYRSAVRLGLAPRLGTVLGRAHEPALGSTT